MDLQFKSYSIHLNQYKFKPQIFINQNFVSNKVVYSIKIEHLIKWFQLRIKLYKIINSTTHDINRSKHNIDS